MDALIGTGGEGERDVWDLDEKDPFDICWVKEQAGKHTSNISSSKWSW
jgi:hypothetical protein